MVIFCSVNSTLNNIMNMTPHQNINMTSYFLVITVCSRLLTKCKNAYANIFHIKNTANVLDNP